MAAKNDKRGKNEPPPIIVKKITVVAAGHHGGAWKVAYADFVTAMMAFFLLMWLLGSTAQGDLDGIAQYFQSPLKVALTGGSGSGDSSSVIKGGGQILTRKDFQMRAATTLLFGLSPLDPVSVTAAIVLLAGVGLGAGYLPARRAAAIAPAVARVVRTGSTASSSFIAGQLSPQPSVVAASRRSPELPLLINVI